MENNRQLQLIGIIHSSLKDLKQCPRQENEGAPEAIVEVLAEYGQGMEDLREGDRVILFTWLHQSDRTVLKTKPRNDDRLPLTGVFSTRSPDRPNPIGIHFVTVIHVLSPHQFAVSGLEVLDQTPLIDIKPDLRG